jgi:hypothetical protein
MAKTANFKVKFEKWQKENKNNATIFRQKAKKAIDAVLIADKWRLDGALLSLSIGSLMLIGIGFGKTFGIASLTGNGLFLLTTALAIGAGVFLLSSLTYLFYKEYQTVQITAPEVQVKFEPVSFSKEELRGVVEANAKAEAIVNFISDKYENPSEEIKRILIKLKLYYQCEILLAKAIVRKQMHIDENHPTFVAVTSDSVDASADEILQSLGKVFDVKRARLARSLIKAGWADEFLAKADGILKTPIMLEDVANDLMQQATLEVEEAYAAMLSIKIAVPAINLIQEQKTILRKIVACFREENGSRELTIEQLKAATAVANLINDLAKKELVRLESEALASQGSVSSDLPVHGNPAVDGAGSHIEDVVGPAVVTTTSCPCPAWSKSGMIVPRAPAAVMTSTVPNGAANAPFAAVANDIIGPREPGAATVSNSPAAGTVTGAVQGGAVKAVKVACCRPSVNNGNTKVTARLMLVLSSMGFKMHQEAAAQSL